MLNGIIDFSLHHRALVIAAVVVLAIGGGFALSQLNIDAFPDTTPVQVQINTVAPAHGPDEIEQQITFAIEQKLGGLSGLTQLRSVSKFGLSQVVVTFEDDVDIWFARQQVTERLSTVELPAGIERPRLGPVTTGLGEIFHYVVTSKGYDFSKLPAEERIRKLTELRTLHDWQVRPGLRTVKGTAEINSWGGYEKQYQVTVDPAALFKHDLTFDAVVQALERNNRNVGGGSVRRGSEMMLLHGLGRTSDIQAIGNIVLAARAGVPIRVRDVGTVAIGHAIRRGAVTADGKGEVVHGLGFMRMGTNSHEVAHALEDKLTELRGTLPPDVEITTVYNRTELVDQVIDTVRRNLFEAALLVIAVLFAFLGSLRAAGIVALAIPLSMLCAFSGMFRFGIAASLLSLGAIDFGMVVDSSVVMVENCVRHIAHGDKGKTRVELVRDAAVEVRKPTLFGELIIMIVYLPILTLEGTEGKMFRPMALTILFALAGSMILSLTLMPVLASLLLPRKVEERTPLLMRLALFLYRPVLNAAMHYRFAVLALALCLLVGSFVMIAPQLGTEFVPTLSEGAIAINVVRLAGTDLETSIEINTQLERAILKAFPDEVRHVWSRIGSAEVATDPMGVEETDLFISLQPRSHWTKARTQDQLTELVRAELRDLPGQRLSYTQPIVMRVNEMDSGVRAAVAVKLFGEDFNVLKAKALEIEAVLRKIDGNADVASEQLATSQQPKLEVRIDQNQIARYGVSAQTVLDLVEAVGGRVVGDVLEKRRRFPLVVRLPDSLRQRPEALGELLIPTSKGERLPLSRLAHIDIVEGPVTISREWGQRRITVSSNVVGRDKGSFVDAARRAVAEQVVLPPGYTVTWSGEFEHYQRAKLRLLIVVPLALALILTLLYLTYHNIVDALRVFTGVPFAWVGGVLALWLRDMPFSIAAGIGFIALSGVAVLDDMILVSTIRQLRRLGLSVDEAVQQASLLRLRPVLMTTLVASLGFVPMALSTGMGAEVQRPLATVVIGGVVSAMVMSLLVLRVLYLLFDEVDRGVRRVLGWLTGRRAPVEAETERVG